MKRQKTSPNEGTLDDFIDSLVSAPPQKENSIKLELVEEEDNMETVFNVLIEIFSKASKYLYGDSNGRVDLDEMGLEDLEKMSKYFKSFGFHIYVEKFEGENRNKTSFGTTEEKPIKGHELKAHCLKFQTSRNFYIIYFDTLNP